jgi:hypothetical protein
MESGTLTALARRLRLLSADWLRRYAPVRLQLANDSRGVEPGLLATYQAVADVKHVQHPEANWRSAAFDAEERAVNVTGSDRLVDNMLARDEAANRLQVEIRNRVHDPLIYLSRGALTVHRASGIANVVPDEIVGVGRKSGGNVVCVLGSEVLLDDVHDALLVPLFWRASSSSNLLENN